MTGNEILVLLDGGEGIEGGTLLELGVELLEHGGEVRHVLLGLGPLGLGKDLLLEGELGRAADAVDSVVGFLGRETAEGLQDGLVLFRD